jgi:hypothetical protein
MEVFATIGTHLGFRTIKPKGKCTKRTNGPELASLTSFEVSCRYRFRSPWSDGLSLAEKALNEAIATVLREVSKTGNE